MRKVKKKPFGEYAADWLFIIRVIKRNLNNSIQRYTQIKCFDGDEAICHFCIEIVRQIYNWLVVLPFTGYKILYKNRSNPAHFKTQINLTLEYISESFYEKQLYILFRTCISQTIFKFLDILLIISDFPQSNYVS